MIFPGDPMPQAAKRPKLLAARRALDRKDAVVKATKSSCPAASRKRGREDTTTKEESAFLFLHAAPGVLFKAYNCVRKSEPVQSHTERTIYAS
jgi:hypothetical protein